MIKDITEIVNSSNDAGISEIEYRIANKYKSLENYDESYLLNIANELSALAYGSKEGWNHLKTIIIKCQNTECVQDDCKLLIRVIKYFDHVIMERIEDEKRKGIELNDDDIRHLINIVIRKNNNYSALEKKSTEELDEILDDISQWSVSLVEEYDYICWADYMNPKNSTNEEYINMIKKFDELVIKEGYIYKHYDIDNIFNFEKYKNQFRNIFSNDHKDSHMCVVHGTTIKTVKENSDEK